MQEGFRAPALALGCALVIILAGLPVAEAKADLVAPGSKCPGQQNYRASEPEQEEAMHCLINHARSNPRSNRALERAAGAKVGDIFDCGFSHTACGLPFDLYPKRFGYTSGVTGWKLGENLAWGKRSNGTARQIFKAWLNSPPHRATMLDGGFEDLGIGLKRGRFAGSSQVAVWVLQMGCRGC